jgi:hypothetical protein
MRTNYTDGGATITVSGDLEAWAVDQVNTALGDVAVAMRTELESVAKTAARTWYQQVHRQTGKSGDIEVTMTISPTSVRWSVGSTDTRSDKGRPVPVLVHRPGALSTRGAGKRKKINSKAGDGKFLLAELVRKPVAAVTIAIAPMLSARLAAKLGARG